MDIDRESSPLSDISILSRTPTPPFVSPEKNRGALAPQQDSEPYVHPNLPLEPPRSAPLTLADWNTHAPIDAPRHAISGELLRGFDNTTVVVDYSNFIPFADRAPRPIPQRPATLTEPTVHASQTGKQKKHTASSSKPSKSSKATTMTKKIAKPAPKSAARATRNSKANPPKATKKRALSPPSFPKISLSQPPSAFGSSSFASFLPESNIPHPPFRSPALDKVEQDKAYLDYVAEIRKRKREMRGERKEKEQGNVMFPGLKRAATAADAADPAGAGGAVSAPARRSTGGLSLPIAKKTAEQDRRARALAQTRLNGRFMERAMFQNAAGEPMDIDDDDDDEY